MGLVPRNMSHKFHECSALYATVAVVCRLDMVDAGLSQRRSDIADVRDQTGPIRNRSSAAMTSALTTVRVGNGLSLRLSSSVLERMPSKNWSSPEKTILDRPSPGQTSTAIASRLNGVVDGSCAKVAGEAWPCLKAHVSLPATRRIARRRVAAEVRRTLCDDSEAR